MTTIETLCSSVHMIITLHFSAQPPASCPLFFNRGIRCTSCARHKFRYNCVHNNRLHTVPTAFDWRKLYTLKTHQIIKCMQSSQTRGCTSRGRCWRMPTFTNYCDVSRWYMCCCASLICSGQTLTCGYESAAALSAVSAARLRPPPLRYQWTIKTDSWL